jgi:hypothetical protein
VLESFLNQLAVIGFSELLMRYMKIHDFFFFFFSFLFYNVELSLSDFFFYFIGVLAPDSLNPLPFPKLRENPQKPT